MYKIKIIEKVNGRKTTKTIPGSDSYFATCDKAVKLAESGFQLKFQCDHEGPFETWYFGKHKSVGVVRPRDQVQ